MHLEELLPDAVPSILCKLGILDCSSDSANERVINLPGSICRLEAQVRDCFRNEIGKLDFLPRIILQHSTPSFSRKLHVSQPADQIFLIMH